MRPPFSGAHVPPRAPTLAQRRALAALASGHELRIDAKDRVWLGEATRPLGQATFATMLREGWVTHPLREMPLFGVDARPGTITAAGLAALTRR